MIQAPVMVISGAATGLGRRIAERFAAGGYRTHVCDANPAAVEEYRRSHPDSAATTVDVSDARQVDAWFDEIDATYGRIDVLVNNAGAGIVDLAETVTTEQAQRLFDTNFFGVLRMNRAVLPAMKRQGSGLLLHVSSGAGRLAIPALGLYCASKFALEALAEVYRYELAALGIDSVVIEPGAYPTPIMVNFVRGEDSARRNDYGQVAGTPEKVGAQLAGSKANPQEIADSVLQIIETPSGRRQLRYRISGSDSGVSRINSLTDEVQAQLIEAFGLTATTAFKAP